MWHHMFKLFLLSVPTFSLCLSTKQTKSNNWPVNRKMPVSKRPSPVEISAPNKTFGDLETSSGSRNGRHCHGRTSFQANHRLAKTWLGFLSHGGFLKGVASACFGEPLRFIQMLATFFFEGNRCIPPVRNRLTVFSGEFSVVQVTTWSGCKRGIQHPTSQWASWDRLLH